MSKKLVIRALGIAGGNLDAALALLTDIDRGFLRRRLNHYIKHGSARQQKAAEDLWKALFPHPEHHSSASNLPKTALQALPAQPQPHRIQLDQPEPFLSWLVGERLQNETFALDDVGVIEAWGLVALAALCLPERTATKLRVVPGRSGDAARFAYALGFNEIITGQQTQAQHEAARTVRLRRVTQYQEIDSCADEMSRLMVPSASDDDIRLSIRYVLIELLRNVIQHSEDTLGGVAAAQLMNRGAYANRPVIQVAVADAGIGIPEHVGRMHKGLEDPRIALERALWPHISGTFPQGLTGSRDNAGLGLFFIAEMAKRTQGRLLVASRGSALVLASRDDVEGDRVVPRFLLPQGIGFPGTLVVFEIPSSTVTNYAQLTQSIHDAARARTPARAVRHWVRFEMPAGDPETIRVRELNENTTLAAGVAKDRIRPAVLANRLLVFDFAGIEVCTQSFLHALMYEAVRLAWAMRAPIYVVHADGPVRSGIEFLESYALGG
ncbi:MAG: hypothetical protein IPM54_15435 [Polyangiaceae bacterium]|nr:hypothetical protein [Polyangiaceae bacterium]